jgi:chromosome segregation ATPase
MSKRPPVSLRPQFRPTDSDPCDHALAANLQQLANLANEHCDGAVALVHQLSDQLREAHDRINQLENDADGLFDRLLAEVQTAIEKVETDADARLDQTIREADESIARLQAELGRATRGVDQVKAEADARIERIKIECEARVAAAETEAKKPIDLVRREIDAKVLRLEADLMEANNRADRAEQWLILIRREIEDHLMPSVTAMHELVRPAGG